MLPCSGVDSPELPVAFGKYQLRRQIARGGMGEVYLATLAGELGFEKTLVVKTILPEHASKPRFVELFAAEAKTAVALSHGNIVPIYEFGRIDETFYIAMGYVDGPSLGQVIEAHRTLKRPVPLAAALFITREVLTGLAYAHGAEPNRPSLVHRDISVRNVLIERSGQVRIVDFGIALPAEMEVDAHMGSHGYIAPEQARAETVDPRADVFSTACVLYELLTLERAFPKPGVWMQPNLSALPPALEPIVARALALDPDLRPADAGAFLADLGTIIQAEAATYGDRDLATHVRELFPHGWARAVADGAGTGASVTPMTRGRARSQTFATRLVPAVPPTGTATAAPVVTHSPRRWPLLVGVAGLVVAAVATAATLAPRSPDRSTAADADAVAPPVPRAPAPADPANAIPTPADPPVAPRPRLVGLRVTPPDVRVTIDGREVSGTSPFALTAPGGRTAEVRIERDGYVAQSFTLEPGDLEPRTVTLAPAAKPRGSLTVLAPAVNWALVKVDGRKRGQTPARRIVLDAGKHRLIVECVPPVCPTHQTLARRTVVIEPNREHTVEIR